MAAPGCESQTGEFPKQKAKNNVGQLDTLSFPCFMFLWAYFLSQASQQIVALGGWFRLLSRGMVDACLAVFALLDIGYQLYPT